MKNLRVAAVLATFVALPSIALALTIQPGGFYNDVRSTSDQNAGINLLTRAGVVQGYPGGRFNPNVQINRAEFLKIAMLTTGTGVSYSSATCFPDVHNTDWFSPFVCAAKAQGIIQGKYLPGMFGNQAFFDPAATVTYGEALKILTLLSHYSIPSVSSTDWAEQYYQAAHTEAVDLPVTIELNTPLTRGLAARLAAAFLAEANGQLNQLRLAENGVYTSSSVSSMSSSSSMMSSSSSSLSSSLSSSFGSGTYDSNPNVSTRSQFVLLGEVGPILGAANIFMQDEPLDVTSISVNLNTAAPSVGALLVYDDSGRYLGKASLDPSVATNRTYTLSIPAGTIQIPKSSNFKVYVRPQTLSKDLGGNGDQLIEIGNFVVQGNGDWSSQHYTKGSTETFLPFMTARSTITSITNAIDTNAPLVLGMGERIGSFTFAGRRTDGNAHLDITNLTFQIESTGGASVSNVMLATNGLSDKIPCSVVSMTVTCNSIPEEYGSLVDGPRTLTLYGDVTATSPQSASLRLTLNDSGDVSTPGSVTWSDGTSSFIWVGLDSPLAYGTYYKY